MADKHSKKAAQQAPDRKTMITYIFWGAAVIAMGYAQRAFNNTYVTLATLGVVTLALYRVLRLDKRFMRVHKAFRTASSIRTAGMTPEQVKQHEAQAAAQKASEFHNDNLNKKLKQQL